MNNEIITVPELAKILKISRSKAYSLANSLSFPIIKIGKNIRIRISDLEKWLNNSATRDIFTAELESGKEDF